MAYPGRNTTAEYLQPRSECSVFARKRSPLSSLARQKLLKKLKPNDEDINDAAPASIKVAHEAAEAGSMDFEIMEGAWSIEDPLELCENSLSVSEDECSCTSACANDMDVASSSQGLQLQLATEMHVHDTCSFISEYMVTGLTEIKQMLSEDKYVQLVHEEYFTDGKYWINICR